MNKKVVIGGVVAVIIILVLLCVFGGQAAQKAAQQAALMLTPTADPEADAPRPITAKGVIVPAQWGSLAFQSSGVISDVLVNEGDQVQAGQVLARLDDTFLQLAVAEARLRLRQAELDLERAKQPADPAELAAAEKAVLAAQVTLTNTRGSYATTVDQAQVALRSAQLAYDHAERDYNHLLDMKGWGYDVEDVLKTSKVQLENARTNLDIAKRDAGGAWGHVNQSTLQAQQSLASAQAQYRALEKQPDQNSVKAAQLAVESAQLALERAEANLADAVLRSPIAGIVAEVNVRSGESATLGAAAVVLADFSHLMVETVDLDEWGAAHVRVGQTVNVVVNALDDAEFNGIVRAIVPKSVSLPTGDTAYTVTIELQTIDPGLWWGMTVKVVFPRE